MNIENTHSLKFITTSGTWVLANSSDLQLAEISPSRVRLLLEIKDPFEVLLEFLFEGPFGLKLG